MQAPTQGRGAWSRGIWIVVAIMTGLGLTGILVDFFGFLASLGPLTGGCAMAGVGFILMFFALLLVLAYTAVAAGLALTGLIFFWRGSRWGPRLLIPGNLLAMGFFYWSPVGPGQVAWAAVVVLLGALPAIAVALLVWALLARGTWQARIAELVLLGALALPLGSAYAYGIETDIGAAFATPPPAVAAAHGCGPSTTASAAEQP